MEATAQIDIAAPVEVVARRLLDFGGLAKWHPAVEQVRVEGKGVGTTRSYRLADHQIVERLDELDEDGRGLSYTVVEGPLTVTNFRAKYRLSETKDGATHVVWSGEFDVARPELEAGMRLAASSLEDAGLTLLKLGIETGIDLTQKATSGD